MRMRNVAVTLGVTAFAAAIGSPSALAAVTPGWECVPTTAGQAVVSGGTSPTPSCGAGSTPVLAPTYVSSGVGGKPTAQFSAVNVQILNGAGGTATTNGEGNLVLGYDETPGSQTGSHDLILGRSQAFTKYGELVAGSHNTVTGPFASALGYDNRAGGTNASALGGAHNLAKSDYAAIAGGCANIAGTGTPAPPAACTNPSSTSSDYAAVLGGAGNTASGLSSAALGGHGTTVSGVTGIGPSSVTSVSNFNPSGSSTETSGPAFLGSQVVHFSDANTVAHVTASLGEESQDGNDISGFLEVCYAPAAGGTPTSVSMVKPEFDGGQFQTYVQSVTGAIAGLTPGDYRVGLCAESESSNLLHGYGAGTIILGEQAETPSAFAAVKPSKHSKQR